MIMDSSAFGVDDGSILGKNNLSPSLSWRTSRWIGLKVWAHWIREKARSREFDPLEEKKRCISRKMTIQMSGISLVCYALCYDL